MVVRLRTPLVLVTDDDLERVSRENSGYRFEREDDGTIIVRPSHTKGGAKRGEACGQLHEYKKRVGGNAYASNSGFAIGPRKRIYAPSAAWVSQPCIDALTPVQASGFWPLSPDVAIEVKSDSDTFRNVVAKIVVYLERGSRYAVAIDPTTRDVVQRGIPPAGLVLDFDAIIDA
jgi:Uma2 family endonuclease